MPFYSSYTSCSRLVNELKCLLDTRGLSSFKFSRLSDLSPTTTRKIYSDPHYIPSPDVLERICLTLDVQPGDLLRITPIMDTTLGVCSGVFSC